MHKSQQEPETGVVTAKRSEQVLYIFKNFGKIEHTNK